MKGIKMAELSQFSNSTSADSTRSTTKHTPGPWGFGAKPGPRAVTLKRTHWAIGVNGGKGVAIAFGDTDANAEFIVRACNSHDDLLAALKDIIAGLPSRRDWLDPVIEAEARAAIAKAEGRAQ